MFKNNLKKLRKENNLSQEELADKLGVSRQSVSKWESGSAYPEMDKTLQLCKMFNVNIDDLLNNDLNLVEERKEQKNNALDKMNSFIEYVTKTINVFFNLSFKSKIKCILEQIIIICALIMIYSLIGILLEHIFKMIFYFLIEHEAYYILKNIFSSIYLIIYLAISVMLVLHIFKIRYLDYFEVQDEDKETEEKQDNRKISLKKEKIIIRDPKNSSSSLLNFIYKILVGCFKLFLWFILICFVFSFICFIISLVLSFAITKSGLIFVGILVGLIGSIILNMLIIILLFNIIHDYKSGKRLTLLTGFSSLILIGVGIGIFLLGLPSIQFDLVPSEIKEISYEYEFDEVDAILEPAYYFEEKRDNILVVIKTYEETEVYDSLDKGLLIIYTYLNDEPEINMFKKIVDDLNNKKIINYSSLEIEVHAPKEVIDRLTNVDNEIYLDE